MLTIQIQDDALAKELGDLLEQKFGGDTERMLQELIRFYSAQNNRMKYSGILQWEKDGLAYQKEVRSEW